MEPLGLLAECSITFAGFAAVLSALRGSQGLRGSFRAWTTVSQGLLAFVLSLLPLVLARAQLSEADVWRIASGIAAAATSVVWIWNLRVHRRLNALGEPAQAPLNLALALSLTPLSALLLLSNALGWPRAPGPFPYVLGIVLFLIAAVVAMAVSFWIPLRDSWNGGRE